MALEHILTGILRIPFTQYFDDFTFIGPEAILPDVIEMTKDMMFLLGWQVKEREQRQSPCTIIQGLGGSV